MVYVGNGVAQQLVNLDRPEVGLKGMIAIHSTALGPAAGGCRLWAYADERSMRADAIRLAEGMSYKNALAGLPLGGGKAVLMRPPAAFDRAAFFRAFGEEVAKLDGAYVTAEDVGTTTADMLAVRSGTRHVAGLPVSAGQVGGDPSPSTARGVFLAMEVAVQIRLGRSLRGARVAVQGLGNVGFRLCNLLNSAGAELVVADPDAGRTARAHAILGATVVSPDEILRVEADILAPCALGGVLNAETVADLKVALVCGGANNQLASPEDGARLAQRDILYAPDYIANAGGIINVAAEYLGWDAPDVEARVDEIGRRMRQLLYNARATGSTPDAAADELARATIAQAGREAAAA